MSTVILAFFHSKLFCFWSELFPPTHWVDNKPANNDRSIWIVLNKITSIHCVINSKRNTDYHLKNNRNSITYENSTLLKSPLPASSWRSSWWGDTLGRCVYCSSIVRTLLLGQQDRLLLLVLPNSGSCDLCFICEHCTGLYKHFLLAVFHIYIINNVNILRKAICST